MHYIVYQTIRLYMSEDFNLINAGIKSSNLASRSYKLFRYECIQNSKFILTLLVMLQQMQNKIITHLEDRNGYKTLKVSQILRNKSRKKKSHKENMTLHIKPLFWHNFALPFPVMSVCRSVRCALLPPVHKLQHSCDVSKATFVYLNEIL
jgi:hypothetical protein